MPFSANLRHYLSERKMTQAALARRVNRRQFTIFRWLSAKTIPRLAVVAPVADALPGVTMYAAFVVFMVGTTLFLGSWYGLLWGLIPAAGLALRAVQEERTLRAELLGYDVYRSRVKYRFIPYICKRRSGKCHIDPSNPPPGQPDHNYQKPKVYAGDDVPVDLLHLAAVQCVTGGRKDGDRNSTEDQPLPVPLVYA